MMEIPAGKDCDGKVGSGHDLWYWACPFFSCDDGTEFCSVFGKNMYGFKCDECEVAYPNGATVEIKPR